MKTKEKYEIYKVKKKGENRILQTNKQSKEQGVGKMGT